MDKNSSDYNKFKSNEQFFIVSFYAFLGVLTFIISGIWAVFAFTLITSIGYWVRMSYHWRKING